MKDIINRFYDTMCKKGWNMLRQNMYRQHSLPACISSRYVSLPPEWIEFFNSIRVCANPDGTAWFLCMDDFDQQGDDTIKWNEPELISLQAAMEENDAEWQRSIITFWDNHFPVYFSMAGDYEYYAIRMSDGAVVHGAGPEFEETDDVASSFARFMEMICTGEYIL